MEYLLKYIKLAAKVTSPVLTNIYNSSIMNGSYPDILKIAEVIPLYKTGSKHMCSNRDI